MNITVKWNSIYAEVIIEDINIYLESGLLDYEERKGMASKLREVADELDQE